MDQTPATTPAASAPGAPAESEPAPLENHADAPMGDPGFRGRGRLRRRVRFLRKARELAYRDLGGLVFNLHRFGQRHDVLVIAKLTTLTHIDTELRTLEAALDERHPVTILREAGVSACPRCAAIHSGDDRFCPNCGLSMSRRVELPVAGPPAPPAAAPSSPAAPYPQAGVPLQSAPVVPAQPPITPAAPAQPIAPPSPAGVTPPPAPRSPAGSPPASLPVQPHPQAPPASPDTTTAPPFPARPTAPPAESRPAENTPAGAGSGGDGESPVKPPAPPVQAPQAPSGEQPTQVIRPPASGT